MSIAYSGNYEPSMYNPDGTPNPIGAQKRYKMHFQKGVPLSSNELDEIQEVSDAYLRQLITMNFPSKDNPTDVNCKCYSTNNGFQIVESTDPVNNFLIKGGDGTFEGAGILIVDGYILFLKSDLEYKNQGYSTGTLVDDRYTKTWPAAPALHPPTTNSRIDVVYIDFYFAEVSATGLGVGTAPPEYKDTTLIVPGIGFSTANRVRMVQDVCVMEGVEDISPVPPAIPEDGPDANSIYHRFVKIATITRDTTSNITTSMIVDDRVLINSLSSYSTGDTITDLVLADGQDIGSDDHRIGTIWMSSIIDYSTDLRFLSTTETIRFTTTGRVGVGTTDPQAGIQVTGQAIRIDATSPELNFYNGATSLGFVRGTSSSIDIEASSSREINFNTNGFERVVILPGGNMGIGTTDPQQLLHVQGNCLVSNDLFINGSSNFTNMIVTGKLTVTQAANDNGIVVSQTGAGNNTTVLQINNAGTGPSLIVNTGRVGIGTTNPGATLHVGGDVIIDNNMTVNGTTTIINTEITAADMLEINQNDNQVALAVNQTVAGNSATVMTINNSGTGYALLINNGRVGIGSTAPQSQLDVAGDLYITGDIRRPATDFAFLFNSSELFRFTSTGRLGINSTSPQSALDVVGSGAISQDLYIAGNLGIGSTTPTRKLDVTGDINFTGNIYRPATDLAFIFNSSELFRMTSGGSLGIGTTNPQFTLHCEGQAYFNTITGGGIRLTGDNGTIDRITTNGYTLILRPDFPGAAASNASVDINADSGEVLISAGYSSLYVQGYDTNRNIAMTADGIDFTLNTNNALIQFWGLGVDSDMITTTHRLLQIATASNGNYSGMLKLDASAGECGINAGLNGLIRFTGTRTYIDNTNYDPDYAGAGLVFYGEYGLSDFMWSYGTFLKIAPDKNGLTATSASADLNSNYGSVELRGGANILSVYSDIGDGGDYVDLIDLNAPNIKMHGGVAIGPGMTCPTTYATLNIVPGGFNGQSGINFYGDTSTITAGYDPGGATNPCSVSLCGGRFANNSYGGHIVCDGNDYAGVGAGGNIYIRPGNTTYGQIRLEGTTTAVDTLNFSASATYFHAISYAPVLNFQASVALDAGVIQICHGVDHGTPSSTNGAYVYIEGNGAGSSLILSAGSGTTLGGVTVESYDTLHLNAQDSNYIRLSGIALVNTTTASQTQARIVSDSVWCGLEIYRPSDLGGDVLRIQSDVGSAGNTVAKVDVYGRYYSDAGTTISSPAADFAEWATVVGDISNYDVGTVVQQSLQEDMKVDLGSEEQEPYGIVTDRATFCGGFAATDVDPEIVKQDFKTLPIEELEKKYNAKRIAMTGHVVCKVVGKVMRGQRLVLSTMPGVARAALTKDEKANSFAIARQSYDSDKIGLIEVRL